MPRPRAFGVPGDEPADAPTTPETPMPDEPKSDRPAVKGDAPKGDAVSLSPDQLKSLVEALRTDKSAFVGSSSGADEAKGGGKLKDGGEPKGQGRYIKGDTVVDAWGNEIKGLSVKDGEIVED